MKCPICNKDLEEGRGGSEPQYYWAGCDPCGFYTSARTHEELEAKLALPQATRRSGIRGTKAPEPENFEQIIGDYYDKHIKEKDGKQD